MNTYDSEYGCDSTSFDLLDNWCPMDELDELDPYSSLLALVHPGELYAFVPFPELQGLPDEDTEVVYDEVPY
jgi:hypothetical protein